MAENKRLLIIKAASDVCAAEVGHLKVIADMFAITHCTMDLQSIDDFNKALCQGDDKFDYIYLAAHADTEFFGERDGSVSIPWPELASAFCNAACLKSGAILLLGCCRGGLKRVALSLFCNCMDIDYVCGPRWTVCGPDISTGFHVFIYNMEVRREQPSVAVCRASQATNYEFFCHDRVEMQDELNYSCGDSDNSLP